MKLTRRIQYFFNPIFRYEFWPYWIFYIPAVLYGALLAIRARSLTYFTAVNPGIKFSGAFGCSKYEVLKQLDEAYLPVSVLVRRGTSLESVLVRMNNVNLDFPVIAKPDYGERGVGIEKINDPAGLARYLEHSNVDFIVQEYIDYNLEFGILYYHLPGKDEHGISSIFSRKFLTVTGDGKSTIEQLIMKDYRAHRRRTYLSEKYGEDLHEVLGFNERRLLEPIGNHNRGTQFLDATNIGTSELADVFHRISSSIRGFHYGRYDLKVKSLDDLYRGQNIRVIEVNGVNSEPGHIYDPGLSILKAYASVFRHMNLIYRISTTNHKNGVPYSSPWEFFREGMYYLRNPEKVRRASSREELQTAG